MNEEMSAEHQTIFQNVKSSYNYNKQRAGMSMENEYEGEASTSANPPPPNSANEIVSIAKALEELLPLLTDNEEQVVLRAVQMIAFVAKKDSSSSHRFTIGSINNIAIIQALNNLFIKRDLPIEISLEILSTFYHILAYNEGLNLFLKFLQSFPSDQSKLLDRLLSHLQQPNLPVMGKYQGCHKNAILILHSLMACTDPYKTAIIDVLRKKGTVTLILKSTCLDLLLTKDKLFAITVDIIKILCEHDNSQKITFINNQGLEMLIYILAHSNYDNLLLRGLILLKSIAHLDETLVVKGGVFKVLGRFLHAQDSRIRKNVLELIRDISHVPISSVESNDVLIGLMELLSGQDLVHIQLSIDSLSNLVANNQHNKSFFLSNHGLSIISKLIYNTTYNPNRMTVQAQLEQIEERAFAIIRNLSGNYDKAENVLSFIMHDEVYTNLMLHHLFNPRPAILRQILKTLMSTSKNPTNYDTFARANYIDCGDGPSTFPGFISCLIHILKICVTTSTTMDNIEGVSINELIYSTISTLANLIECRDLYDQVTTLLLNPKNCIDNESGLRMILPSAVMMVCDDKCKAPTLQVLAELAKDERIATILGNHVPFIEIIKKMSNGTGITSLFADSCYRRVVSGTGYKNDQFYQMDQGGSKGCYYYPQQPPPPNYPYNEGNRMQFGESEYYQQGPSTSYNYPHDQTIDSGFNTSIFDSTTSSDPYQSHETGTFQMETLQSTLPSMPTTQPNASSTFHPPVADNQKGTDKPFTFKQL
uniref:Armadillo repeat-containing protein 10 n=1 Tax=Rhabditophanes sp. KR3021 TaxID=114890 RepID=A0AC35UC91_9BILA